MGCGLEYVGLGYRIWGMVLNMGCGLEYGVGYRIWGKVLNMGCGLEYGAGF